VSLTTELNDSYWTLAAHADGEYSEKRSKFLAYSTLSDILKSKHQIYKTELLCTVYDWHQQTFIHTDSHSEVHVVVQLYL